MTTYRSIASTETDPQAPVTSSLMKALEANPLAIAESDPTAPVNQSSWHPYNKTVNNGGQVGRFYSFAIDGAVATFSTPDFEGNYEYMVLVDDLQHSNGTSADFRVEVFRDTDAAHNPAATLIASVAPTGVNIYGWLHLPFVQRADNGHVLLWCGEALNATGNFSSTGAPVTVRTTYATSQKIRRVRFSFSGGNINEGSMFLYRRRLII